MRHRQERICGIMQPFRRKPLPPLPRSIDISAPGSLLLFFIPPTNQRLGCPGDVCFDHVWLNVSFSCLLVPQASVSRHSQRAHHHDTSLSCGFLGDECSLRSVPRDWCTFRACIQFRACAVSGPPCGKTRMFSISAEMLRGTDDLQCPSFHAAACKHFQSLWPCCVAFWSTTMGSDLSFILSTTSLKMKAFLLFHPTIVFWQVSWTSAFLLPFLVLPASSTVDVLLALLLFLQLR